ncbi:hypothetical protein SDC9_166118 [bioreactor metagenome]|uniref:Uncharacterized protein n=1 Tax=bioreactor metagenome TaxID=1076179 RepID=A0A645FWD3_9ZZZZ
MKMLLVVAHRVVVLEIYSLKNYYITGSHLTVFETKFLVHYVSFLGRVVTGLFRNN